MGEMNHKKIKDTTVNKKKKRVLKKRFYIIIPMILMVFAVIITGSVFSVFYHYYGMLDTREGELLDAEEMSANMAEFQEDEGEEFASDAEVISEEELAVLEQEMATGIEEIKNAEKTEADITNILLIGVDSRKNSFTGRSDAMILVSLNKDTKTVLMTSFLRDMYVSIPDYGNNRLNAAYAFGGTTLLSETISLNFGIDVDKCVVVNFYLVMDVVNALGGVDVTISADEIRVMNEYIESHNNLLGNPKGTDVIPQSAAGVNHLNGSQALAYSRVRYVGTDFARTGRQREIISLCLDKMKTMSLGELNTLMETVLPKVRTDLTETDCAELLLTAVSLGDYTIDNMTIPMDGTWSSANINGMSVLRVDFKANSEAWHQKQSEVD